MFFYSQCHPYYKRLICTYVSTSGFKKMVHNAIKIPARTIKAPVRSPLSPPISLSPRKKTHLLYEIEGGRRVSGAIGEGGQACGGKAWREGGWQVKGPPYHNSPTKKINIFSHVILVNFYPTPYRRVRMCKQYFPVPCFLATKIAS